MMKIRSIAMSHFGENNIRMDTPMATLDEVLVPLYFLHRYQTEAASKVLGGNEYTYAVRGDGQPITKIVPGTEQRRALKVLLQTIDPGSLLIPERILNLIPPRPPGYPRTRETFPSQTGLTFDPFASAEAGADLTVSLILNSQRAARLVQYHSENSNSPGLREVIDTLMTATWRAKERTGMEREIAHTVDYVVLVRLMSLALDASAPPQVRAIATDKVNELKTYLTSSHPDPDLKYALDLIAKFQRDPEDLELPKLAEAPPGQPIGDEEDFWPWD